MSDGGRGTRSGRDSRGGRSSRSGRTRAVVILVAYPSRAGAVRAARALVGERALACATVQTGATAFYRWKGKEVREPSTLLWGKTTATGAAKAVKAIEALHPDDVPEILVLRVEAGNRSYLDWLARSVGRAR